MSSGCSFCFFGEAANAKKIQSPQRNGAHFVNFEKSPVGVRDLGTSVYSKKRDFRGAETMPGKNVLRAISTTNAS